MFKIGKKESEKAVIFGKFYPFHAGHKYLIERAMKEYGAENILVVVCGWRNDFEELGTIFGCYTWKLKRIINPMRIWLQANQICFLENDEDNEKWILDARFLVTEKTGKETTDLIRGDVQGWEHRIWNVVIYPRENWPFPNLSSTAIRSGRAISNLNFFWNIYELDELEKIINNHLQQWK